MRAKRTTLIAAATLVGMGVLAAAAAFSRPVQTWAARKTIALIAGPRASIEGASAGWGRISLDGLRLDVDGAILAVPSVEARVGVLSVFLGGKIAVTSLVAKGWTLDLTHSQGPLSQAEARETGSDGAARARQAVGLAFSAFKVPARASLDGVDLEGTVILSDEAGRPMGNAQVVVTGGGLSGGKDGSFRCGMDAAIDDKAAPVTALKVTGLLTAAMDGTGTLTRAELKMAATASGRQFPDGVGLSGAASAVRSASSVSYSVSLDRGAEEIASLGATSAGEPARVSGEWSLNLKDTDLEPFALGRALPAFNAAGHGRYELDPASGDIHAQGKLNMSADRLGVVGRDLAALGPVDIVANFDVARTGDSLRVDKLEVSLSGADPVASVTALQPFEFNAASGELKVARPLGDLVGISVTGVPLSWLKGALPWIEAAGGDLKGEFVMRAEGGRLALRTRAPLEASEVALSRGGRQIAVGLEFSAFVLADYAPKGWQVQLAPFAVRSEGVGLLSLEARFGRLAGTGEPIKAEGSWSVSLPALMAQPAAARLFALSGGDASGSFAASLGATRELRLKVALANLASPATGAAALPSANADISADFGPNGRVAFSIPLHLTYPARTADMDLSGTLASDARGSVFDETLSGGSLSLNDLKVTAVLFGARLRGAGPDQAAGGPAPAASRERAPFWPAGRGRVSVRIDRLSLPQCDLGEVRGALMFGPGSLELEGGSAKFGGEGHTRLAGRVLFSPGAAKPYSLQARVSVSNLDSAPFFRAMNADAPPAVEGRFDLTGELTSDGDGIRGLADAVQGECKLSSRSGSFRALRTGAIEPLRQNQSRIVDALDSVTSLFGKKADKSFDAVIGTAEGLSDIHYDQLNIDATRGADLDLHFTQISLVAPEEHVTGSGTVTHVDGALVGDQPLVLDLNLGVRGRLESLMGIVGMLKDDVQDDLGYTPLYQPIHLRGTLRDIDQSQWRDMLVRAPLRKAGGLFDKLLGR